MWPIRRIIASKNLSEGNNNRPPSRHARRQRSLLPGRRAVLSGYWLDAKINNRDGYSTHELSVFQSELVAAAAAGLALDRMAGLEIRRPDQSVAPLEFSFAPPGGSRCPRPRHCRDSMEKAARRHECLFRPRPIRQHSLRAAGGRVEFR